MSNVSGRKLHIELEESEAEQLLWLISRALNSLQPEKWPALAEPLLNYLETFIQKG